MKKYKPLLILLLLALLGRMSLFSTDTAGAVEAELSSSEAPVTQLDEGSSPDQQAPQLDGAPQPGDCYGPLVQLDGSVDATSGHNNSPIRFGTAPDLRWFYSVPDLSFEAGTVSLPQVITWDAYEGRENTEVQPAERVRVEFFLEGNHVASSPFTDDLADGVASVSLVSNLGTMDLPNGADEVRIVHYDWFDTTTTENSLVVTALCFEATPASNGDASEEPQPEAPAPACDDDPATPEPAEGCPSEEPSCDDDPSGTDCDQGPAVCDDDPNTPEPAGGCTPTPACDDDPETPEPAEGCDDEQEEEEEEESEEAEEEQEPAPTPKPGAGDGDQAPELAVTGSTTETLVAAALILLILGIAFDGAVARGINRIRTVGSFDRVA